MTYPATDISNRAAGDFVTDVMWDELVDALNFLANRPACRVFHSVNQSITNNTATTLAFNSERFDTNTMHDTATNNSRITMTTAGLYLVNCSVALESRNDYNFAYLLLRTNGSTTIGYQTSLDIDVSNTPLISVTTLWKFAAADYVEARILQVNGAAAAANALTDPTASPEFSAVWVGRG